MIKEKYHPKKIQTQEHFKQCQNKIIELLKTSKQRYYQKYFEEIKKRSETLWNGIHEIIYSKKKKSSTPSSLLTDGKIIINQQNIAETSTNSHLLEKALKRNTPFI